MPEAAKNYSITELEMCGLAMNIATFSYLLKKVDFDVIVNHLAITHSIRSTAEPLTTRTKRLLELLSPYSFNLYYIKGNDMVLSNFLSRQKTDDSNPHQLIPISFSFKGQVSNHFYHIDNEVTVPRVNKYLVQTRSQVRSSGIRLPEIHGTHKVLDHTHNKVSKSHFLFRPLTKECLHFLFLNPELARVESDQEERSIHISQYHCPNSHPLNQ